MSGKRKAGKASIHISKPEPPPFLQRIREQMVANEANERREQGERRRKERGVRPDNPDDDPTVVKLGEEDLTEEEYKRLKIDLETQYRIAGEGAKSAEVELDVDTLIRSRAESRDLRPADGPINRSPGASETKSDKLGQPAARGKRTGDKASKSLSYGSSDDDDDD